MLDFLDKSWKTIAAGNLMYSVFYWPQQVPTFKEAFKKIAANVLNLGFYYYSPTIARAVVENAYYAYYGPPPSLLTPFSLMDYYHNETLMIGYALNYGPYVMYPLGLKICTEVVEAIDKLGLTMVEVSDEIYQNVVSDSKASNKVLRFSHCNDKGQEQFSSKENEPGNTRANPIVIN